MNRKKPLHLRLADTLRQRIGAGRYEKNGLPPELVLMKDFGVSRHTIRAALQRLVADGLIERRAGRGTSVTKRRTGGQWVIGALDDLLEFSIDKIKLLEARLLPARDFPDMAALLNVPPRGRIFRLVRRLAMDERPCAIAHLFVPAALAAQIPPDLLEARLLINLIEQHCGVRTARVRQVASAARADRSLAAELGMAEGDPVQLLNRSYTSTDGDRIMHAVLWCRPDRYQHTIDFIHEKEAAADGTTAPAPAAAAV